MKALTRRATIAGTLLAALIATTATPTGSADAPGATTAVPAHRRRLAVHGHVSLDRRTGFEWTRRDHQRALDWPDADLYCRGLRLGSRRDWRLPEIGELQGLYDPRVDEPCGNRRCHLDRAVRLADPYVWSSTARGEGTRFYFDFAFGSSLSPAVTPTLVRRVLCVRPGRQRPDARY